MDSYVPCESLVVVDRESNTRISNTALGRTLHRDVGSILAQFQTWEGLVQLCGALGLHDGASRVRLQGRLEALAKDLPVVYVVGRDDPVFGRFGACLHYARRGPRNDVATRNAGFLQINKTVTDSFEAARQRTKNMGTISPTRARFVMFMGLALQLIDLLQWFHEPIYVAPDSDTSLGNEIGVQLFGGCVGLSLDVGFPGLLLSIRVDDQTTAPYLLLNSQHSLEQVMADTSTGENKTFFGLEKEKQPLKPEMLEGYPGIARAYRPPKNLDTRGQETMIESVLAQHEEHCAAQRGVWQRLRIAGSAYLSPRRERTGSASQEQPE